MAEIITGFPSTSQDNYQFNTINILRHAVRNYAKQEIVGAYQGGRFSYTYAEAYRRVKQLANALKAMGAQVGDRIGVLDWNSHRHYEMYFGIPGLGCVILLLNLRLPPGDLSHVVNHANPKYIVVDESLISIAESIAPLCKGVKGYIIITDKDLDEIDTQLSPVFSYEALLKNAEEDIKWPVIDEKSAYGACYTTGTTGKPKGVYYSHRNVYLHTNTFATSVNLSYEDTFFQLVPMFHVLGWGAPQAITMVGGRLVLPGNFSATNLETIVNPMVAEKVTVTASAPALLIPMLEHIRNLEQKPDFSRVRMLSGATEPSVSLMKGYHSLTGLEIIHAYGATETTPLISLNRIKPWLEEELDEDQKWDLKRCQGYPLVGLDLKVVDAFGDELPHDGKSAGEILIRGPWITGSYYNAPGSENNFTEDGYWKSGDAGTIDAEGYIKITDRVKDVIKSGGEWISSVDMENEIMAHDYVLEASVTGVAHPKWEERPVAVVVAREEHKDKITKADIIEHLSRKFAKWQLPEAIFFVDEVPKTSVGKFNKKVIREQYKDVYLT